MNAWHACVRLNMCMYTYLHICLAAFLAKDYLRRGCLCGCPKGHEGHWSKRRGLGKTLPAKGQWILLWLISGFLGQRSVRSVLGVPLGLFPNQKLYKRAQRLFLRLIPYVSFTKINFVAWVGTSKGLRFIGWRLPAHLGTQANCAKRKKGSFLDHKCWIISKLPAELFKIWLAPVLRNVMVGRCMACLTMMCALGLPFILEQPSTSVMEYHPCFQFLARQFRIYKAAGAKIIVQLKLKNISQHLLLVWVETPF